jgi:hypothetical protein
VPGDGARESGPRTGRPGRTARVRSPLRIAGTLWTITKRLPAAGRRGSATGSTGAWRFRTILRGSKPLTPILYGRFAVPVAIRVQWHGCPLIDLARCPHGPIIHRTPPSGLNSGRMLQAGPGNRQEPRASTPCVDAIRSLIALDTFWYKREDADRGPTTGHGLSWPPCSAGSPPVHTERGPRSSWTRQCRLGRN